ncbi:hypothetical protein BSKO_06181 [Bryopsis sp. KO-2023]|nr:hypothetical protein BSKO_06181 [Bryopsis sp. KO-2023]
MDLDVTSLQEDLKSLRERRFETNRQLRELSGRGRGRGRGRGLGGRFGQGGSFQGGFHGGRGNSTGFSGGRGANFEQPQYPPNASQEEGSGRIKSAVVLRGRERLGRSDFIPPVLTKRPAATHLDKDQNLKKRNRRMFGALLGTLQQFCEEDQKFKESTAAQKRQDALNKAEERQQRESMVLRQKARDELKEKRHQELCKLWDIDLETNVKILELVYASKIQRHKDYIKFIKTETGPPLLWLPGKHNEKTREMLLEEGRKYDRWKEEQVTLLAEEKEKLKQADEEKRKLRAAQQQCPAGQQLPDKPEEQPDEQNAELPPPSPPRRTLRSVVQTVEPPPEKQHKREGEEGELPFDAKLHAAEQERIEEEIAAEEMAQSDDLIDDIA